MRDKGKIKRYLNQNEFEEVGDSNSWKYVDRLKKEIDSEEWVQYNSLKQAWKLLEASYAEFKDEGEDEKEREQYIRGKKTPVEHFTDTVDAGNFPSPEVLLSVAMSFNLYLRGGGNLSLEECFFGPETKGLGNYAKQNKTFTIYHNFQFYVNSRILSAKKNGEKQLTNEEYARQYLGSGVNIVPYSSEPESFVRGYARWKAKEKRTIFLN